MPDSWKPSILVLAASILAGCVSWGAWTPDRSTHVEDLPSSQAIELGPNASSDGRLDCASQRCEQWFRVDVDQAGQLRVEARVGTLADGVVARLFLQDGVGNVLDQATSRDGLPLRVSAPVEPGLKVVLLQIGGSAIAYTLGTRLE